MILLPECRADMLCTSYIFQLISSWNIIAADWNNRRDFTASADLLLYYYMDFV